jgi:DeoR/GlpR family transcriptional regulator of sugar metabolism
MSRGSPSLNGTVLPAIRQRHALDVLQASGFVECRDLQERFKISEATARRDIAVLVRKGAARRIHGGAMRAEPAEPAWGTATFSERSSVRD